MAVEFIASLLYWLGILFYGGPLLTFAVLLPVAFRVTHGEPWHLDRVYRATGPMAGLGLGAIIVGGILGVYLRHGGFEWALTGAAEHVELAKYGVFFLLWVNYTLLEVWTLEPLRRLDTGAGTPPVPQYFAARRKVTWHLVFNALLFLLVMGLGLLELALRSQA